MFRSSFRFLAVCALSVAAAAVTSASLVVHATVAALHVARDWVIKVVTGPVDMQSVEPKRADPQLVRAAPFLARILKRERPRMEAGWRMCPST